jgi:hypothetical protein
MDDTPFELILVGEFRHVWSGIEPVTDDYKIKILLKFFTSLGVLATEYPALIIRLWFQFVDSAIEPDFLENPEVPGIRIQIGKDLIAGWKCWVGSGHRPIEKLVGFFRKLQMQGMISVLPDSAERSLSLKYLTIKSLFKEGFSCYQSAYACTDDAYIVNFTSHLTLSLGDFAMNISQSGIKPPPIGIRGAGDEVDVT